MSEYDLAAEEKFTPDEKARLQRAWKKATKTFMQPNPRKFREVVRRLGKDAELLKNELIRKYAMARLVKLLANNPQYLSVPDKKLVRFLLRGLLSCTKAMIQVRSKAFKEAVQAYTGRIPRKFKAEVHKQLGEAANVIGSTLTQKYATARLATLITRDERYLGLSEKDTVRVLFGELLYCTKETTHWPMQNATTHDSKSGVFFDPSKSETIEAWIVCVLRPLEAKLPSATRRETVQKALREAVAEFAQSQKNGTVYLHTLPTGRLALEMKQILPPLLHLSREALARAFLRRLWKHAQQITRSCWNKDIKNVLKKFQGNKIPEKFIEQAKADVYEAFAGERPNSTTDLHKAVYNAALERWLDDSVATKRAKFLKIALLVYNVVTAEHLQAKYDHGSVLRMRAVARLMRSVKALYIDFRKDFDEFFVPKGRALASYTTDTEFKGAVCCALCYAKFESSGVHWYQVQWCKGGCGGACSRYKVGCSHTDYDGEYWCSYCVTLVSIRGNPVICCTGCADLDWGRPCNKRVPFWNDNSIRPWQHRCTSSSLPSS